VKRNGSITCLILAFLLAAGGVESSENLPEPPEGPESDVVEVNDGATAAESEEKEEKGNRMTRAGYRILPIPIIISEPAVGKGLGIALALFHPVKEGKEDDTRVTSLESMSEFSTPRQAPPVVTGVAGAYTDSKSWFGGIGHSNNWKNDSIRYIGLLAAARVNSQVYILNVPVDFSMEARVVYQDLKFRIGDSDFLLGGAVSYLDADNRFGFGLPDGFADDRFAADFNNVGVAGKIAYETRDNSMNPRSGQIIELSLWRYDDAIGGDYDYWSAKLKALSFHSLTEKTTLGLRLEASGVDGNPPFFAIPWVKLRGVPALRYQNKVAGAVEIEGRYRFRPRIEFSVFGGLGFTSDDYPIFDNPDSIYNFGFGGRYNIFEEHNVWVGMDIARGPEDWNWYIQVGHPW
jgi:hypothetical protein